jgi:hypothetical protein
MMANYLNIQCYDKDGGTRIQIQPKKELPLIELSIIFGMVLMWGLFCVIFPKSQYEPAPRADATTGVGPGAGAGAGTGTGAL